MSDATIKELIEKLEKAVDINLVTQRLALREACKLLRRETKKKFGVYQQAAGEFEEWAPLAESTKKDRVRQGFPEDEPLLRTGELRKSIQFRTTSWEGVVGSNKEIMVFQELGTSRGIPPRSTLGAAAYQNAEKVANIVAGVVAEGILNNKPIGQSKYRIIDNDEDGDNE